MFDNNKLVHRIELININNCNHRDRIFNLLHYNYLKQAEYEKYINHDIWAGTRMSSLINNYIYGFLYG